MLGSLVVLDLFLLCCTMQRTQEQITFLAGAKGAKMIPRDFKIQHEDSFSLNFRLPGNPTHEGKFPTHVPGNCMQRGLQEHRWETAFGSFFV